MQVRAKMHSMNTKTTKQFDGYLFCFISAFTHMIRAPQHLEYLQLTFSPTFSLGYISTVAGLLNYYKGTMPGMIG